MKYTPLVKPSPPEPTSEAKTRAVRKRIYDNAIKRYETRREQGIVGECTRCSINVYEDTDRPAFMPCGVYACPFERRKSWSLYMLPEGI
jgi:hypothetical protein